MRPHPNQAFDESAHPHLVRKLSHDVSVQCIGRQSRWRCFRVGLAKCAIALSATAALLPASPGFADDWTNVEGTKTIDAAFMGMWGDMVVLRLPTGKRAVIPKRSLNAESRLKAEEMASERAERREMRIAELAGTDEGDSPGIVVAPTVEYSGPSEELVDLPTAMRHAAKELSAGHLRVVWDDLPASYQQDIRDLVKLAAENVNAQDVDIALRMVNQLGRTLAKQKNYVFNYHRLESVPPEPLSMAKMAYDPLTGIIQTLGDTELLSLENLGSMPLDDIIAKKDEQLAPYLAALFKLIPPDQNPVAQLEKADIQMVGDDQGTLTITGPGGESITQTYVRVDGRWMEQTVVQMWDSQIANAREALMGMSGSESQLQMPALAVGGMLTQIENAASQQEFDQIIDMLFGQIMSAIPANLGTPPAMTGAPGTPPATPGFGPRMPVGSGTGFGPTSSGTEANSGGAPTPGSGGPARGGPVGSGIGTGG